MAATESRSWTATGGKRNVFGPLCKKVNSMLCASSSCRCVNRDARRRSLFFFFSVQDVHVVAEEGRGEHDEEDWANDDRSSHMVVVLLLVEEPLV